MNTPHFTILEAELYDETILIESLEELCCSLGGDGVGNAAINVLIVVLYETMISFLNNKRKMKMKRNILSGIMICVMSLLTSDIMAQEKAYVHSLHKEVLIEKFINDVQSNIANYAGKYVSWSESEDSYTAVEITVKGKKVFASESSGGNGDEEAPKPTKMQKCSIVENRFNAVIGKQEYNGKFVFLSIKEKDGKIRKQYGLLIGGYLYEK